MRVSSEVEKKDFVFTPFKVSIHFDTESQARECVDFFLRWRDITVVSFPDVADKAITEIVNRLDDMGQ